jgi:hypothetical protein
MLAHLSHRKAIIDAFPEIQFDQKWHRGSHPLSPSTTRQLTLTYIQPIKLECDEDIGSILPIVVHYYVS